MAKKAGEKSHKKSKKVEAQVISGFYVLPVAFPGTTMTNLDRGSDEEEEEEEEDEDEDDFSSQNVLHYMYAREHKTPGSNAPSNTLFLANLPIDATTMHIHVLISQLLGEHKDEDESDEEEEQGRTRKRKEKVLPTSVTFLPSPTGSQFNLIPALSSLTGLQKSDKASSSIRRILPSNSSAHVTFASAPSLARILAILKYKQASPPFWTLPNASSPAASSGASGYSRYTAIHARRFVPAQVLQSTVDSFMERFNAEEEERERAAKRARSEPDADGFVTVTRGAGAGRGGVAVSSDAVREAAKEKMKKKELKDFYRFQVRERKKERMNDLLMNFKKDQEKIVELKAKRKFKPFAGSMA
ncbi:ribosomal RNA-processing protein 7-domain-containing protein [Myxozyma melibiosi]|uniref:Ribosomal RNA-processing protein 7-domain-containing protein n=1 Tax=Myxozyma melibiosi TaxID=54550 RepID=A0ABR1F5N9_9ASCO